jgi:hypothetical protein
MTKTRTSLNEDTFFQKYGSYKEGENNNGNSDSGYHYDDYEDFSDND